MRKEDLEKTNTESFNRFGPERLGGAVTQTR